MRRVTVLPLVALLCLVGLLSGCGGSAGLTQNSSASDAGGTSARSEVAPGSAAGSASVRTDPAVMQRQVVSTGTVRVTARQLERPRDQVDRVVAAHHGVVADERSGTDRHGDLSQLRLVVRVPSAEFGAAMHDLAAVPGVRDSDRTSDDVTTQVIDTAQRVKAQRVGLTRVEDLLGRAGGLSEVLALEKEITRRQAELDSLLQQQAYLADQTSLSTITVTLTRTSAPPTQHDARPAGFWAGLSHGWHALGLFLAGLFTGVGAVLPFAAVAALVGGPVWLVLRRRRALASRSAAG
ncbi:DUF4349 domain-containing protein [Nocardioides mangrovicus]|uniref:DUF4349 domain-containing protein n=1 Tax=Nocardioides mangrovicus TaxID=2478913 RepID=A0A3L8P2H6_9ACTN|nr:DUF4349 domain-containing protein [Nocardioides mangrovicus]RLV49187.1 DUF4349 domain-containing protein [Nocardioides mangrovicus]